MKQVRFTLVGAALAVLVVDPPMISAQQVIEVTLEEAVRRALEVQPAIVQAQGDRRNAAADKRTALGSFLPTVTTGWSASRSNLGRVDPTTGRPVPPEYVHTVGLSANVTLFDGLGRFSAYRASSAEQEAAEAGYVSQRYLVTLETKVLFYAATGTEALVRVSESQLVRAEQQLQISTDKLRAGSATRSDSLRSAVEYGNAQLDLLEARSALSAAQAQLGRQIGIDGLVRARWLAELPPYPDTVGLTASAIESSPEVRRTQARAQAARARVWEARSTYIPRVVVSYNDNYQGTGWPKFFGFDGYDEIFTWRFGLSWTLFNGFNREAANVSAGVQRDTRDAEAGEARRGVRALVTERLARLANSHRAIEIARSNIAAATEDFRVQQERYRVGASTILDMLSSQAALTQAEVDLLQKNYDYVVAIAELEALLGREL